MLEGDHRGAGEGDAADAGGVIRAFVEGDLARLGDVLHADVELRLTAFVDEDVRLQGREEVLRWFRRSEGSQRSYLHRVREIAPGVWLAFGRVQLSDPSRGMRDYQVVWMVAVRDGLLWRASSHETEPEARAAVRAPRP